MQVMSSWMAVAATERLPTQAGRREWVGGTCSFSFLRFLVKMTKTQENRDENCR